MRECIYCGRQLEKGEKCGCAISTAKRAEREKNSQPQQPKTKKEEKAEERAKKQAEKQQRAEQKTNERAQRAYARKNKSYGRGFEGAGFSGKNIFANVWRLFISFLKSPIDTMLNPGSMGLAEAVMLAGMEGAIGGLCVFALTTGASRGVFSFIGNAVGFHGLEGYQIMLSWLMSAVSGIFSGIVIFFLFTGIFYLVSRFIFRQFIAYTDFIKRFAFVSIPMSLIGIIGTVLGLFSVLTFTALILGGLAVSVILTYELLRSMWSAHSTAKVLYTTMICLVIFMLIAVRLAVLF